MDVLCAGILVADIFSSPIDSLPAEGDLTLSDRFLAGAGGCAANTSACLRRLGKSVTVVGRVGQDVLGDIVLRDLIRLGVDVRGVAQCDAHSTSGTFILNVRGQDRRYIHCFGANAAFRGSDVNRQLLGQAKVFYVGGFLAMPAFSAEELLEVLSDAKRLGIITVLDVAIPAGLPAPLEQVELVLGATDYFLPNEDEARMLTGLDQPAEQIERLQSVNPDCTVVITRGERGHVHQAWPGFH